MTKLSSTTLFNFTDSLDFLINNLREGIYCGSIYEKLPHRNTGYQVPMTCFCDIPLSLISDHFTWYGRYGIGISRTFARAQGVSPVWYVTSESNLVKSLVKNKVINEYERKYLLPYLKKFMGNQEFVGGKEMRKKFYDEREWRYIPDKKLVEPFFGINNKRELQVEQEPQRMRLDLTAVEYIIIDNEKEFDKILPILKEIQTKDVSFETLISKIMTSNQIEKDF